MIFMLIVYSVALMIAIRVECSWPTDQHELNAPGQQINTS